MAFSRLAFPSFLILLPASSLVVRGRYEEVSTLRNCQLKLKKHIAKTRVDNAYQSYFQNILCTSGTLYLRDNVLTGVKVDLDAKDRYTICITKRREQATATYARLKHKISRRISVKA